MNLSLSLLRHLSVSLQCKMKKTHVSPLIPIADHVFLHHVIRSYTFNPLVHDLITSQIPHIICAMNRISTRKVPSISRTNPIYDPEKLNLNAKKPPDVTGNSVLLSATVSPSIGCFCNRSNEALFSP